MSGTEGYTDLQPCDEFRGFIPERCEWCGLPDTHHQTAPAVDSDDGPEQSGAPLPPQGAPLQNASPVATDSRHDATGLAAEGWGRAIELAGHVARLTGVLELILHRLDRGHDVSTSDMAMAREALALAAEAITS